MYTSYFYDRFTGNKAWGVNVVCYTHIYLTNVKCLLGANALAYLHCASVEKVSVCKVFLWQIYGKLGIGVNVVCYTHRYLTNVKCSLGVNALVYLHCASVEKVSVCKVFLWQICGKQGIGVNVVAPLYMFAVLTDIRLG